MKSFKLFNNLVGWLVFLIAATTYCLTVESTASFWDCPEFITAAHKLEVGHSPGAPFFMLTANLFSQLANSPQEVSYWVNILNALLSAFCILFLFWSITHLTRKLIAPEGIVQNATQTITIIGAGLVGALVYTWSDTFWYSAVEAEVYAFSSMFTALVFWLILKWEDHADSPNADRWLIAIFYLTGLSIGVHLLNLLCLPAIVLVYYYKRNPDAQIKGSLKALAVSAVLVAAVLYGVVPGIVKVGGWFELFFVNTLDLPFNAGFIAYIFVLVAVVGAAIWASTRDNRSLSISLYLAAVALLGIPFYGNELWISLGIGAVVLGLLYYLLSRTKGINKKGQAPQYFVSKRLLNTSLLSMLMLIIGYSTYAVIVVRSVQNPPMDQNSPEDVFSLGSYLNREQYGTRPLFYGEAFSSRPIDYTKATRPQRHEKTNPAEADKYDHVESGLTPVFPTGQKMLFPRMYSSAHAQSYESWLGGITMKEVTITDKDGNMGTGQMPSQWDNLRFFMSYQINFMYWRYFMWNFVGRQNDLQSQGEQEHGQWITGISFIDNLLYGDQSKLPESLQKNKGRNVFYALPLLLGLLGMFWQCYRGRRGVQQFWVVFFLFFMTGLAIVLYLNQTPGQPRERDYAYVGSFYAFAMWIGLGVAALADILQRYTKTPGRMAAVLATFVAIIVPLQMVSQTWDDHDRSGRYAARDFGANYLHTLDEKGNPIIFTNGDNDTFPLWYNQDVEGVRTDARVCNLSYLHTDWYIDQMKRPAWKSPSLPITWKRSEYVDNTGHDYIPIQDNKELLNQYKTELKNRGDLNDPYELSYLIDHFVRPMKVFPTDSFVVKVDKAAVLRSGMHLPFGKDSIPTHITVSIKGKNGLTKSEMMVYEMLAHHNWERPLYMSATLGASNYAGLDDYLLCEGLAYRVTPFRIGRDALDTERMYNNLMHKFRYGNVKQTGIYLDETVMRMCHTHRNTFVTLIQALLTKGEKAKALKALDKCETELPGSNIPYTPHSVGLHYNAKNIPIFTLPACMAALGKKADAERVLMSLAKTSMAYLDYYNTLSDRRLLIQSNEAESNFEMLSVVLYSLQDCGSQHSKTIENYISKLQNSRVGATIMQMRMQRNSHYAE